MNTELSLVEKRDRLKKWVCIGALGLVGFIVAPFIYLSITGLIGLGIAAAVGFTLVQLAPVFALKIANLKYRMADAEKVSHIKKVSDAAAENPIETMTAMLIAKNKAFEDFKENVVVATTARDTFKKKLETFTKAYPHRAAEFKKQLERMVELVEKKKVALANAQQSLEDGQLKLDEMRAYWEMSQVVQEANKAAGMDTGDLFEKLKHDTACDAVFDSMNRAFAQMEVAASLDVDSADKQDQEPVQLGHSEPNVLDVPVRETQKVNRQ